jgi:pilus assembly protein CpaF
LSATLPKRPFYLDEYLEGVTKHQQEPVRFEENTHSRLQRFHQLCELVKEALKDEMLRGIERGSSSADETAHLLFIQKRAIIGYPKDVNYFITKIDDFLKKNNLTNEWFPDWFNDLKSAIFHEAYGLTGVMEWKTRMKNSTSCKIIGERIYCLIDGKMVLQPQRISKERLNQLVTALMLRTPATRLEGHAEVYMLDGTRISIFLDGEDGYAKEPTIVFRKYVVEQFTFEEQAKHGTIPADFIEGLKAMATVGFNVGFIGPVRSGKTTFLQTWQSYEDPSLEGIMVETDPEIALHLLMPKAPIMQIVADGDKLKGVIKKLLRADGDYMIMAEARDGVAMRMVVEATSRGTRRVKFTYHTSDAVDFCYDAANSIVGEFGGDIWANTIKIAKNVHYLFEFVQLKDKSKKRLKGIYEIRYDPRSLQITIHQICKYDFRNDSWTFKYDIGPDKEAIAEMEDYEAFTSFRRELQRMAERYPMQEDHITELPYFKFMLR